MEKAKKCPLIDNSKVWHIMGDSLVNYLHSVPDLWALSCSSKDLRIKFANPFYVRFILNRNLGLILRRSYDLSTADLHNFLSIQRGSVLSGSVVLQAYTGDIWGESDLDIYLPYLNCRYRAMQELIMKVVPNCDFAIVLPVKDEYAELANHVAIIEVQSPDGKRIQFIFCSSYRQSNLHVGKIVKTFDLTTVQNYYDGLNWKATHVGHILNRVMQLSNYKNVIGFRNVQRIKKYEKRGFTFVKTEMPRNITPMAWMYIDDVYKTAEG